MSSTSSNISELKKPVYFDNSASGIRSKKFVEYYCKYLSGYRTQSQDFFILSTLIEKISIYLCTYPENISLVPNATYGLNEVAHHLKDYKPDLKKVFISDSEHSANYFVWLGLYPNSVSVFPLSLFSETSQSDSSVIYSLSLTSNLEGIIVDPYSLHKPNPDSVLIADASQYMQHYPIDISRTDIDYLVFTAHKFYGSNGIGVVYSKNASDIGLNISNFFIKKSLGYDLDFASLHAWSEVFDEYSRLFSSGEIQSKESILTSYFLSNFPENPYIEIINRNTRLPIFLLRVISDEITSRDFCFYLEQESVIVRSGLSCSILSSDKFDSFKVFRVSLSYLNTESEIDYFFSLIKSFSPELCF